MVLMGMNAIPGDNDLTRQTSAADAQHSRHQAQREEDITNGLSNSETATRNDSLTDTVFNDKDGLPEKPDTAGTGSSGAPMAIDSEKDTAEADPKLEMQRRDDVVHHLARTYTQQSHAAHSGGNPFEAGEDSVLNPANPNFSGRAWAKSVVNMIAQSGSSPRTTGVAFQNLNVFGFGEATDYQKNVLNVWLTLTAHARRLLGSRGRRIDILRSFDGVVHKGEMLVVLGPPGSGCSTFLKTIAGETNGLYIDEQSYFNYQG